jgi:hypothetical protein
MDQEARDKLLNEWKGQQPRDASCSKPDFKMFEVCPDDCPYNAGPYCELYGGPEDD